MEVGGSSYIPYENPSSAQGIGLWEAPRGSLIHWIKIESSKVNDYQVIAPTTWNVCPNGPLENALVGTPVGTTGTSADLLSVAYVVRSFDLCLACTVHMVDAKGNERYLKVRLSGLWRKALKRPLSLSGTICCSECLHWLIVSEGILLTLTGFQLGGGIFGVTFFPIE